MAHALRAPSRLVRYRDSLEPWLIAFEEKKLQVAWFDEVVATPGGLIKHFASLVGVEIDSRYRNLESRVNESLSAESVAILSKINERHLRRPEKQFVNAANIRMDLLDFIKGEKFSLPAHVLSAVSNAAAVEELLVKECVGPRIHQRRSGSAWGSGVLLRKV